MGNDDVILRRLRHGGYLNMDFMPELDRSMDMSQWDKLQIDCGLINAQVNYVQKRIRMHNKTESPTEPAGGNLNYEIEHFYL